MKHTPVAYEKPVGEPIGVYYGQLSPDGWCEVFYQPEFGKSLTVDERLEFVKLVSDFLQDISNRKELEKYARKYGKCLTSGALPTHVVRIDETMMTYEITITGVNCSFKPFRKES